MELKEVINKRFLQAVDRLIKDSKVSSYRSFCSSIEVHSSTYNDIKSERRSVTIDILEKLYQKYNINYLWMLNRSEVFYDTKNGNAEIPYTNAGNSDENQKAQDQQAVYSREDSKNKIYILEEGEESGEVDVTAFSAETLKELPFVSVPWLGRGEFFIFKVRGDSMSDTLSNGDRVWARHVTDSESLKPGEVYVIITKDGMICRRFAEQNKEVFVFKSDNDAYPAPVSIAKKKVSEIFRVIEFSSSDLGKNLKDKELIRLYRQLLKAKGTDL